MSLLSLFEDLIKTIKDIHAHPDFATAAPDLIKDATDALAVAPEVVADIANPTVLLGDVVTSALTVAQSELVKK